MRRRVLSLICAMSLVLTTMCGLAGAFVSQAHAETLSMPAEISIASFADPGTYTGDRATDIYDGRGIERCRNVCI